MALTKLRQRSLQSKHHVCFNKFTHYFVFYSYKLYNDALDLSSPEAEMWRKSKHLQTIRGVRYRTFYYIIRKLINSVHGKDAKTPQKNNIIIIIKYKASKICISQGGRYTIILIVSCIVLFSCWIFYFNFKSIGNYLIYKIRQYSMI